MLIDANGGAHITGFGCSMVFDEQALTYITPNNGEPQGGLRWAAPERLGISDREDAKPQHPTIQSDMYSFGSIMLQVCGITVSERFLMKTHSTLSRFYLGKSRIITIPAMKSLTRSFEGKSPSGRIIRVSQTFDGSSFNGVGLLSRVWICGRLARRSSRL